MNKPYDKAFSEMPLWMFVVITTVFAFSLMYLLVWCAYSYGYCHHEWWQIVLSFHEPQDACNVSFAQWLLK
jgi:hypothetical protein